MRRRRLRCEMTKTTTRAVVRHHLHQALSLSLFRSRSKMFSTLKFQSANPTIDHDLNNYSFNGRHHCSLHRLPLDLRLPLRFRRLSAQSEYAASSEPSVSSHYTTSVGSSSSSSLQLSQWKLSHRHILVLNVIACAAAVSATWLFFSAIPALLAFKRAAESLEKLMDVTREELPETMAAVRLSGMEISDLTMELSDLGQEITQGVRSSTKAVRIAEERLRQLTNMNPSGGSQPEN